MQPVEIHVVFDPLMPSDDVHRTRPFDETQYRIERSEPFEEIVEELTEISVTLMRLLPDPSLGPDERLERLARVVPNSQLVSAHRRTARSKLDGLRGRLSELVPDPSLTSAERLAWLIDRLDELVPGEDRAIKKLETIGDFRSTDTGLSPWRTWA